MLRQALAMSEGQDVEMAAGEADEDDSLERLAAKRRPSAADLRSEANKSPSPVSTAAGGPKTKEDGVRKIRLKLGGSPGVGAPAGGSPTPTPSTGAKDGDTG